MVILGLYSTYRHVYIALVMYIFTINVRVHVAQKLALQEGREKDVGCVLDVREQTVEHAHTVWTWLNMGRRDAENSAARRGNVYAQHSSQRY